MEAIFDALAGTPWYVYLIFFYVVYTGFVSLQPRTVKFHVIFILPAILTLWSLSMLYTRQSHGSIGFFSWAVSLVVGIATGWWILSFYRFHIDRKRGAITLPGNKWTLILGLAVFIVRYAFGYMYATRDLIPKHLIISDLTISGFLIGIFIGRVLHYCRLYFSK